ncbi:glycosyltransferase [soil metagenome]
MKVAYLTTEYPSVSHTFIRREIQALERRGVEIQRIAVRGWNAPLVDPADIRERDLTKYVLRGGLRAVAGATLGWAVRRPLRLARMLRLGSKLGRRSRPGVLYHWIYVAEACVVARWMAQSGAQHVHAHFGTNSATVAMLVGILTDTSTSFTIHGPDEFDRAGGFAIGEKIRRSSFVAGISSFGRSQLMRWVDGSQWSKIHVVRCGLDREFLAELPSPLPTHPRFVCVARLSSEKGHLLLLQALRRLLDGGLECELVLAGDGEMRHEVEALIDELELGDHVRITGWISGEQVREELRDARALVMPSFVEGLPVVIMEAMACGRMVISTAIAGVPELVIHGETGWLMPPGDVDALEARMRECLEATPEECERLAGAARRRVAEMHDIDVIAEGLAELFADRESSFSKGEIGPSRRRGEVSLHG